MDDAEWIGVPEPRDRLNFVVFFNVCLRVTVVSRESAGRTVERLMHPRALCRGHRAPHSFYFPEQKYEHAFDTIKVAYSTSATMLARKSHQKIR